ncbi:carbohydrate esterase family 4 protein [Ephemerocybe angulata]|uniref:Carbohydrate esterase family 4 protein n=1 Tax=Ephemerocybe angulata TaxID=980116 RepID=A0A8H6I679_9AGAR|nr:carbohydrate esterase family 4 protein [Tulosesus angulatus]
MMYKALAAAFLASGALQFVSASPLEPRQTATVYTHCTAANKVALTFDDGPYNYLTDIVNTLDAAGAKGTFFFNGNNWGCIYDTTLRGKVKYAYDHGHQVASHTWAHKDLTTLTWDQIHDEMWRVEQALQRITGAYPAWVRPPYGNYNDLVKSAAGVRGLSIANWDFDSGDSTGASAAQSKSSYDQIIGSHPSTILALNHETYSTTAYDVLPYAIQKLKAAGYQLVTVAECLGKAPYQSVGSPQTPDGNWHC